MRKGEEDGKRLETPSTLSANVGAVLKIYTTRPLPNLASSPSSCYFTSADTGRLTRTFTLTRQQSQGIIQGHLDTPLNDHGRFEADRLGKALASVKFDEAYASPLSRAFETAEIVLRQQSGVVLVPDDGLKERCLGSMEGRRRRRGESAPDDAESHAENEPPPEADPSLAKRTYAWFKAFLASHAVPEEASPKAGTDNLDEPRMLILSHGAWIAGFCRVILSDVIRGKVARGVDLHAHLLNTSLMKVRCVQGKKGWSVELLSFGDMSHLEGTKEPDLEVADDV